MRSLRDFWLCWLVVPCWCISCNPDGHVFLPVLSRWVGTLRGARPLASLDTPLHVSRKDYCLHKCFCVSSSCVRARSICFFFSFFVLFVYFFSQLVMSRIAFARETKGLSQETVWNNRVRMIVQFPPRSVEEIPVLLSLTGIKYFQWEQSLDEFPRRCFRLKVPYNLPRRSMSTSTGIYFAIIIGTFQSDYDITFISLGRLLYRILVR